MVYETQDVSNKNGKLLSGFASTHIPERKNIMLNIKKNSDIILHSLMCCIGGFMGGYALLCRRNLGSAQTINLIDIVFGLLGRNREELLLRVIGLLLYAAGIEFVVLLSKKTHINIQRYSIAVDIAGFLVLAALPGYISNVAGLLPIFFMLSTQWSVFSGTRGYNSSSVFSTNNLRQIVLALSEYFLSRDRKQFKKALFFINSLFWFHANVALSYFLVKYFGVYSSLFGFVYAIPAFLITYIQEKKLPISSIEKAAA
jgi:uncharacterized membrane protein YoaK (UPF0700 family)